ncbi:MAG: chemotaxis protein CheA, partial [Acidobacteriota bacterium]
ATDVAPIVGPHEEAMVVETPAEGPVAPAATVSPGPAETQAARDVGPAPRQAAADRTIRVDVGLLDRLMNLVGELVLARNQVLALGDARRDPTFNTTAQRLNLITGELQEGVMKTRMQPIGSLWSKLHRLVRDVATACGKQVRLEMEGEGTELDRSILEAIRDPLTHLVRNAVDHGLESPEERRGRGKEPEGVVRLKAWHEGGQVNIEIADDGAGLRLDRIRERAVERGVISRQDADVATERELSGLIFEPGFSTAASVTSVSGRGVGMDVVRTNIESIGGALDIASREGRGMTLRIKIPLTLAIVPALTIDCAGQRYAIPQVNLLELVRLESADARSGIESIQGTPVYRLRGRLLPLVDLRDELGLSPRPGASEIVLNIVVLQADGSRFGLLVDQIADTQEIVVKPVGRQVQDLSVYAGATILGDGRVALILDVLGLAQRAHVLDEASHSLSEPEASTLAAADATSVLLVSRGDQGRLGIPLSSVARLEEIERDRVEHAGEAEVVQYRGELLRLVRLTGQQATDGTRSTSPADDDRLQVVVHSGPLGLMGLVVDSIIDIVREPLLLQAESERPEVLGTAVLQGRVTEILDLIELNRSSRPRATALAGVEA